MAAQGRGRGIPSSQPILFRRSTGLYFGSESIGHIDHETIFHIAFSQALQHFVDLAHLDEFDVRGDVVLGTKLQHFARFTGLSAGGTCDAEAAYGDECWRELHRVGNAQ